MDEHLTPNPYRVEELNLVGFQNIYWDVQSHPMKKPSDGLTGIFPVVLLGPVNLLIISSMHSSDSQRINRSESVAMVMLCSDLDANASASLMWLVAWSIDSLTCVDRAICISVGFFSIARVVNILFRRNKTTGKLIMKIKKLWVLTHDAYVFWRACHLL